LARSSVFLPGEASGLPPTGGSHRGTKDEMAKRPEESDGRVVPEGGRKLAPTAEGERGGKAATASEEGIQLRLSFETAENPKGTGAHAKADQAARARASAPKSKGTSRQGPPAMRMEEVTDDDNLRCAFEEVARNKGAAGPDGQAIEEVRVHLDELLPEMKRELLEGRYQPGMIRRVWIPKAGGGERGLGIPNVVDRVVQQAVHRVLGPNYEPTFHEGSHGFRPGRSCHTAIAAAKRHMYEGYGWVVDLDLEKFFDRVHHERLLARLGQRVKDPRLTSLIRRMLKAKVVMPDGVVVATEEGTPQGGPLSPLLSNIVLDELDRELEQRGHRFVRYADDCNIYVRSERAGKRVMAAVVRFIESRLRLKVNATKSAVARPGERHFVGFTLRRKKHVAVKLSQRSRDRVDERIRELTPRNWGGKLEACIKRLNQYLKGWIGFFGTSCTKDVIQNLQVLDGHIRRRLRALLLRQWRRRRSIASRLVRLGTSKPAAWGTVYNGHRSLWALSHTPAVERALGIEYFRERGLVSLETLFRDIKRKVIAPEQLTPLPG
jgi:RNA-directed DNA polymerase